MDNTILNQDDQQVVTNQDNTQVETEQVEQPDTGTQQDNAPEFGLDKDGNFYWNTDEYDRKYSEEDSEGNSNQQQETPDDGTEQQEQPETEENENTDTETKTEEPKFKVKVDGEEIEVTQEELLRGYMRQKDYTQKTQQLAQQRKQFEQYQPQQQFQPQQQQMQQQQQPTQQQSADLNAMAKEIAAKSLGLESVDDLSELDFNHITAVVEAKQSLLNQRNQMMYRQQNINNLEAQLRNEEPRYDEIMSKLGEAIQGLPVSRYNKLQQAYNDGNVEPLREFFKEMQKDYYSKSIQRVEQKKKPSVPVVEHSSNTPVVPTKRGKQIDYRKFGHMTTEQKSKVLLELGLLD